MTAIVAEPLVITEPGIYTGIPDAVYHADPVPGGSLSSSGARKLLPPSCPARFRWERDHPVYKDVFDFGSAAHRLVLGTGPRIAIIDTACIQRLADSTDDPKLAKLYAETARKGDPETWASSAAKAARELARADGAVPLLIADFDKVSAMAAAIQSNPLAAALLCGEDVQAEVSLFWHDQSFGIWRRARLDALRLPGSSNLLRGPVVADYKSATSASPAAFARSAANYGYHQQDAWYRDAVEAVLGERPSFYFIAQEKEPPYLITVCELDHDAEVAGRALNRQAMEIYRDCAEAGSWPGHYDGIARISLPIWAQPREDFA